MSTFSDVLGHLEGGDAFEQLNDELAEVVLAVQTVRKAGEITVKLKVSPNGERAVSVTCDIKTKVPQPARAVTTFFTDQAGNMLRRDPRQAELPLREVPDERASTLKTM